PACWLLMRSDSDTAHSRGLWYGGISAAAGSPAATLFGGKELVGELLDRLADTRLRRVQHHRLALVHRLRHDHVAGDQRVGTELEGPLHLADVELHLAVRAVLDEQQLLHRRVEQPEGLQPD